MTKFIVKWDEHHRAEVDADDPDDALEKAAHYAGEHDTNVDSDNYSVSRKKYTVRWTEKHTVWGVEADSEEEAIENALQMTDGSYHSSGDFTAVVEEDDVD